MFKLIAALVAIPLLVACSLGNPERPDHVPVSAKWAGGADGGVWIVCNRLTPIQYACMVFDSNGKLLVKGRYLIRKGVPTDDYEGYDGVRILLKGGGYLEQASDSPAVK